MRIMYYEYDMTEFGYVLADTDTPRNYDAMAREPHRPLKLQSLLDPTSTPSHVVDLSQTDVVEACQRGEDASPDEIRAVCHEIMSATHPDWYVNVLRISEASSITLDCYNRKDRNGIAVIVLHSDTYGARFRISIPTRDHGQEYGFHPVGFGGVEFPLPRKHEGSPASEYLFSLSSEQIYIAECADGKITELTFRPNKNGDNYPRVIAAEYIDL